MDRKDTNLYRLMSVITPTHNSRHHLRDVVESVNAQTVPVYEHIIIDDGSSDDTQDILKKIEKEFSHVRIVFQKRSGAAAARNKGIEVARGRYIAFLDVDDLWGNQKVEKQLRFMEKENCIFSYGDYAEINIHNQHIGKYYRLPFRVGYRHLLRGCPIGCLTAAYNQEILGKRYMPLVKSGHDWGLWLELAREGVVAYKYPGVEAFYSNGKASLSSRKLHKIINIYKIYRDREKLSIFSAAFRTVQHSILAVVKKARLIYN